jgi:hypothetical protein
MSRTIGPYGMLADSSRSTLTLWICLLVHVGGIAVDVEDHVTSVVSDSCVWVGSGIVADGMDEGYELGIDDD